MISVIIPAYNTARFLGEAIDSVLQQDIESLEIIVVDDGSTDNTQAIATSRNVRCIYQENSGVAAAMNTGINACSGDYIASIDADDQWVAKKLQVQLEALKNNPQVDIVFGHVEQFLCPSLKGKAHTLRIPRDAVILPGYSSLTMFIRREAFFQVGLFDTRYRIGDFIEWYGRAAEIGLNSLMLPEILARRRIHGSNTGVLQKGSQTDYLRILKASLDRRRAAD